MLQHQSLYSLAAIFTLAYGLVFIHLSAFVLALRKKAHVNYIFAALLFDYGLMCLVGGAGAVQERTPDLYYALTFTLLVALGPLTAAYAMDFLGDAKKKARLAAIAAESALVLALGLALGASGLYWRRLLSLAYAQLFLSFSALGIVEMHEIGPSRCFNQSMRVLFLSYWGIALELLALCVAQVLLIGVAMRSLWVAASVTLVVHTFLVSRNPEIYQKYEQITSEARQSKTRLAGTNPESLLVQLERLMDEERLFTVASLQIEELARRLSLTGPQLSELLNRHLGKNYSEYINGLRVTEARKMLLERPELGILDLCYECGFSSKSSFNAVFKRETGCTPSDYRRKSRGAREKA
jgi:AraC-type DNA-binding domain-containing proteins